MKGSTHLLIGATSGLLVGLNTEQDIMTVATCTAIGGAAALFPDLDTNGLASNRLTMPKKASVSVMRLAGVALLALFIYQAYQEGMTGEKAIYGICGFILLTLSKRLTQRRLLTLTGGGIICAGLMLGQSTGVILLGGYIAIASFLPHRSYTHSLSGLAYFAVTLHYLVLEWPLPGAFMAGLIGYGSHLVADMKCLPMNRRGVKWFLPLWNKEF